MRDGVWAQCPISLIISIWCGSLVSTRGDPDGDGLGAGDGAGAGDGDGGGGGGGGLFLEFGGRTDGGVAGGFEDWRCCCCTSRLARIRARCSLAAVVSLVMLVV